MPKPKYAVYENLAYETWIRTLPCLLCGQSPVDLHHLDHARRNSHAGLPLCRKHHTFGPDSYHHLERQRFEDKHKINLDWEVIHYLCEYIKERDL